MRVCVRDFSCCRELATHKSLSVIDCILRELGRSLVFVSNISRWLRLNKTRSELILLAQKMVELSFQPNGRKFQEHSDVRLFKAN